MKITKSKLQQIIKEELQNVLNEQNKEQLDEGAMAAALAFLFAGGAEMITIDGATFTPESLEQTVDPDGDGSPNGFPKSMFDVAKGHAKAGLFDLDNEYKSSEFPLGSQQLAAAASGAKKAQKTPSKLKPGSETMSSFNIDMAIASAMGGDPEMQKAALDKLEKKVGDNAAAKAKIDAARATNPSKLR